MTRTCGSKLLLICAICGAGWPDESPGAEPSAVESGVNQITIFDTSTASLGAEGFFAAWGLTISTLTVTGGRAVCASKAQAPKQTNARIMIFRICSNSRTRKYIPDSD